MTVIEGTAEALRTTFSIREEGRVCFVDAERGDIDAVSSDIPADKSMYLASHECDDMVDLDLFIELTAHSDPGTPRPWFAYWDLHQPLNQIPTSVTFCPYCGLNLDTLYTDPFLES